MSVGRLLSSVCGLWIQVARALAPRALRADWEQEWQGPLWEWMRNTARDGDRESQSALLNHTWRAFRAAISSRFQSDIGRSELRAMFGKPRFCAYLCAAPLVVILIASGGLSKIRGLMSGLPYPDPDRVVVLAQGPPFFGVRLGFNPRELETFQNKATAIESISSYLWRTASFQNQDQREDVLSAYVTPDFFRVLGVNLKPQVDYTFPVDEFWISDSFWRKRLNGDPNAVGRRYVIDGRRMRLAGVLPEKFTYLSPRLGLWMRMEAYPAQPPPGRRWWLSLRGSVARLSPGGSPAQAESELRELQRRAGLSRRNFKVHATPIGSLVYAQIRSYGMDLAIVLAAIALWASAGFAIDRRRGVPVRLALRYWGFFTLKPALLLLALFAFLFEFTSVNVLAATGGLQNRGGPLLDWGVFVVALGILAWAWRDQPTRCRVCLQRMHHPLRIGTPGQILLETSGNEVMCPEGHGSVYTSESVLGSEFSKRWMGFEDVLK